MEYPETSYELYHFGVKGMKWGVRKTVETFRKLDRAAKGVRIEERLRGENDYRSRLIRKKKALASAHKSTAKVDAKLHTKNEVIKKLNKAMNKAYSGLTKQEIEAGKSYVASTRWLRGGLGELIGQISASDYVRKNS